MLTRELIARLPKAELHNHLDGSLRPGTLGELARDARVPLPSYDPEAVREFMLVKNARNLEDYLAKFQYTIAVLQTADAIERVAYEMVADAAADNVRYLEVRYCPILSTAGGLTLDQVLDAELRGLAKGEAEFGVKTAVINCSLRHYAPEVSETIAAASVNFRNSGVVGFDLAGGEAGRPAGAHGSAFDIAVQGLLGITVHAGEAAGPESIADAVHRCHANRIGHGTHLYQDPQLMDYLRDRRVPIEINLTSNVETRAVEALADHPLRRYFDAGVNVTLATDGWLMCGTNLSHEYWLAHSEFGFTRTEIEQMILNGFEAAFLPWPEKTRMIAQVKKELHALA